MAAKKPTKPEKSKKSDVPRDFPRILYHAGGHSCLWESGEMFDAQDDGFWASNPLSASALKG